MTRLLVLLPGFQVFGQEQALINLAVSLRECGVESHFLLHSQWGREKIAIELERLGFSWTMMPLGSLWSLSLSVRNPLLPIKNTLAIVWSSLKFIRLTKRTQFSHFLVGNATFGSYLLPALWISKIPLIYRHGDDAADHSFFHRFLLNRLFRRTNIHIANCQYLKRQLRKRCSYIDPVVIYNVPRELARVHVDEACAGSATPRVGPRLVFVGQLAPHKGVVLLLQAFRLLAAQHPSLILDLVGELPGVGGCKPSGVSDEICRVVNEFPGRVIHHGFVSNPTTLFSAAQVHVCPSIYQEPSPNVVLEAKQHRLPSVVFDVGGVSELVTHLVDGYVCHECSPEVLAAGINYFLADECRRMQAGQAAFRSVGERFNKKRFQQAWLEILQPSCVA